LSGPAKLRWEVLGDVQAHGAVAWERLSVPEVGPAVHRALSATENPTADLEVEQRGSIYFFLKRRDNLRQLDRGRQRGEYIARF
jgi:hypothetical protein